MVLAHKEIEDHQFVADVEPYVPFGFGQTIVVEKFLPGAATMRTQDMESPVGDYRLFGTDLKTPPTWSWDLYTDVYDEGEALAWAENLADVWDAENLRREPNKVIGLRYANAGRIRRVFGRPRNFTQTPGDLIQNGKMLLNIDFALAENLYYEDEEEVVGPIAMIPESRGSGWTFPMKFPLKSRIPTVPTQVALATIRGRKPTWLSIDIRGPVVDPWIQIGQYRWGLRGTVEHDRTVTMTGLPWEMGVRRDDGTFLPGMLDPRARLSQLRLPPGNYPVSYGGFDPTLTSRASVRWRNAYGAM
jgi:hypothetical protein